MKPTHVLSLVVLIVLLFTVSPVRATVTVSNVSAAQQPGTKQLEISYDVSSTETSMVSVSVSITDNGTPVSAPSLSGDVGAGVSTGTGKTITWDAGADYPNQVSSNLEVTVTADDGQGGGQPEEGFVYVAPGTDAGNNVTINEPFYISIYEVTNEQMVEVMQWAYDHNPRLIDATSSSVSNAQGESHELLDLDDGDSQVSFAGGTFSVDPGKDNYPCVEVTWYGAVAYCNYLSAQEGRTPAYDLSDWTLVAGADGYRLPSEAQWEYAARGGKDGDDTDFSGSGTIDEVAWYWDNSDAAGNSNFYSGKGTLPVGQKDPNELETYDMSGNVWEWCQDWYPGYEGSLRVIRGGSWCDFASFCRVSFRYESGPERQLLRLPPCSARRPVRVEPREASVDRPLGTARREAGGAERQSKRAGQ